MLSFLSHPYFHISTSLILECVLKLMVPHSLIASIVFLFLVVHKINIVFYKVNLDSMSYNTPF